MRRFKLVEVSKLEPEQQVVLNIATRPQSPSKSESIVVQGMAGSGKTPIGLHILKQLAERVKDQPEQDRPSPLLLTYNRRLAEYCANTLRDLPELVDLMSETGKLQRGRLNVLTFQDLYRRTLSPDEQHRVLDDQECIRKLGDIVDRRCKTMDLLPAQIFALITTFLRGRTELLDLNYHQLEDFLESEMGGSLAYRMYGDSLRSVQRGY